MAYTDLIVSVELKSIRLAKLTYKRQLSGLSDIPGEVDIRVKTEANILSHEEEPPYKTIVGLNFTVRGLATKRAQAGGRGLFTVSGVFEILYEFPNLTSEDFTDQDLNTFAKVNGQLNVWPYFRKTIADAVQSMGFPELLIPVRRFNTNA